MPILKKRDTHCIWFSHLPPFMAAKLARLNPDKEVVVTINGIETQWFRMRNGADGRETKGIRVGPGRSKEIWERIPLRSSFEATLEDNSGSGGPEQKWDVEVGTVTAPANCDWLSVPYVKHLGSKGRWASF